MRLWLTNEDTLECCDYKNKFLEKDICFYVKRYEINEKKNCSPKIFYY